MPANLTPAYLAAEARFRAARTTEEKLAALEEMYATIPKHKGTEKLRADIKRRMSRLREKGGRSEGVEIVREGAGQVVLVGPAGAGKSSLLGALTGAESVAGVMERGGVRVQLVDSPPATVENLESVISRLVREADAVAVVLDLGDDLLLEQFEDIRYSLANLGTVLAGEGTPEQEHPVGVAAKPAMVVGAKLDAPYAAENLESLRELCAGEYAVSAVSVETGDGMEQLREKLVGLMEAARV